jgi:hypothetical protein
MKEISVKTRHFFLLLFLIIFTSASAIAAPVDREGGIEGGGGGTLPVSPASPDLLQSRLIQNAKRDLRLYIKSAQYGYELVPHAPRPNPDKDDKMFGGPVKLFDILEKTDMEILLDRPCKDAFGNDVDGSVHASKPDTICISAFSIAPKVDEDQVLAQTEALIVHELSHILGTTENEARDLQRNALFFLKRLSADQSKDFTERAKENSEEVMTSFYTLNKLFDQRNNASDPDICDALLALYERVNDYSYKTREGNLGFYNLGERNFLEVQNTKVHLAALAFNVIAGTPNADRARAELDAAFGGKESVTFGEFERNTHVPEVLTNVWANEVLHRVRDRAGLQELLASLFSYYQEQETYAYALRFDLSIERLHGPWAEPKGNPWENFLGQYEVTQVNCDAGGEKVGGFPNLTGIKVYKPDYGKGQIFLRRIWGSSWGDQGTYDGAQDTMGGGAVYVDGDATDATRLMSYGNSWGERWNRSQAKLEKKGEGYELTLSAFSRQRTYPGPSEIQGSCKFQLKKTQ